MLQHMKNDFHVTNKEHMMKKNDTRYYVKVIIWSLCRYINKSH